MSEMNGKRVEAYLHSDAVTANKGGSLVVILTQTDFAARTPEVVAFAKEVAKLAYAASATGSDMVTWNVIETVFPHLEEKRQALRAELREELIVSAIFVA